MANNYAKIWTAIFNDPWFLSLSATGRGIWLQLLVWAKMVGDTGSVSGRSWVTLGSSWGCDGKTCRKFLRKFLEDQKIDLTEDTSTGITINIVKYKYYQGITAKGLTAEQGLKPRKSPEKSRKSPPQPDQTRPEQTKADHTLEDSFMARYNELCPSLKKCISLNDTRRKNIRQRIDELNKLNITVDDYLKRCEAGDWLAGRSKKKWKANFEFVINRANCLKICEGSYDSGRAASAVHGPSGPTVI